MTDTLEEKDAHVEAFARREKDLAQGGPAWVHDVRKAALARFAALGFPTTRDEDWRFTSVEPIARTPFREPRAGGLDGNAARYEGFLIPALKAARIVLVNGRFSRELSSLHPLPEGVEVVSLAEALRRAPKGSRDGSSPEAIERHLTRHAVWADRAFAALNTAFIEDGALVRIPDGVVARQPIHIVHLSTARGEPTASHPRTLIVAGRSSQASVLETHAGLDGEVYLSNAVTEISVGENAVLQHVKIEDEGRDAFHIATLAVHLERNAVFTSRSISWGGAIVRNDLDAVLDGEGIDGRFFGLYVAGGRQLIDNHTRIEHAQPHCGSREVYKGILGGSSRAVFNGKILVRPGAQKTDAKQSNKNILLSADAQVDTKPELEIYADDVKCTHGATIGHLDEEALFYCRSRGVEEASARNLLTYAFASEILAGIEAEPVRTLLEEKLFERLEGRGEAPHAAHPGKGGSP
jgi:Fe-S cluster assembly protein SufD